jgi:dihydroflavonol-4-reductase
MTDAFLSLPPSPRASRSDEQTQRIARMALVTGGNGFIGRHLVPLLVARGYFVRILDVTAPPLDAPNTESISGSILDAATVRRALTGVDDVFHLAAIPHLWSADVDDFDRVNRCGTEVMLSAALAANVSRFVHCSTEAILFPRQPGSGTIDEAANVDLADMPGPYTRSKWAAEQAALAAARAGLDVVVVSPTVPIGPGDRSVTPPTAMLMHLQDQPSFYLDCILNLVDVRDVARGIMLAAERGRAGERYILGGETIALQDLVRLLTPERAATKPARRVPAALALAAGAVSEWIATHITHRRPPATIEGVRIALRSVQVSSRKAQRELGYAPSPVRFALQEALFALGHTGAIVSPWIEPLA